MKFAPYLLVNVLVVGAGLLVYDTVRQDAPVPAYLPGPSAGADVEAGSAPAGTPSVVISGADTEFLARRNKARLDELEAALAVLRRGSASGSEAGGSPSAGGPGAPAGQGALDLPPVRTGEAAEFDERTLATLKTYMDEIRRREEEQRRRESVTQELARLDVQLSESQTDAVIDATLTYQDKARDLMRQGFERTEDGQARRREAFEGLRNEYVSVVHSLVPTAEAEKITSGRLGRSFGYFIRTAEEGGRFAGARPAGRMGGGAGGGAGR